MSILLDALRRSEEQRRLGSAPSIHADPGRGPAAGDAAHQWIPLSLIALSAIAMAWIGWQQYQRPADLASADTSTPVEQAAADAEDAGPAGEPAAAERAASRRPTSTVRRTVRRSPVETYTQDEESPQANPDTASNPGSAAAERRARVSESFRGYEAEAGPSGDGQQPGESESTGERALLAPGAPAERTAASAAATEPPATAPISFWELPQGVRDSLPELRITVLVYADRPEDRFLLVGGQRLVEKDEYQSGVVLDEIRRDGAVFLFRSYRFLVKG